jgi:hypothetical protein
MGIGVYGVTRPSDVNVDDIDIYYNYTPNRYTENNIIYKVSDKDKTDMISYNYLPDDEQINGNENILEGLYNLKLPATTFNQLGIYTIYIKPKSITLSIIDCSVLSSLPTVKGIVINSSDLTDSLKANNALQGFRIEYINDDGTKSRNTVRYVVTSNKVSPVKDNDGTSSQKSTRYRFDDAGSLIFLQLSPSSSSDVKANTFPYIGKPNQTIIISNTFFTPLVMEIEMVENTIDTLTDFVAGEQLKDVQKGIITHYDGDRNITKQFNQFEIKEETGDVPLFEVLEKRTNIDQTQDFNNIVGEV